MNIAQRLAWLGVVGLLFLSVMITPWTLKLPGGQTRLQFAPLFAPPTMVSTADGFAMVTSQELAYEYLLLEWLTLAIAAACMHMALRSPSSRASPPPGAPPA